MDSSIWIAVASGVISLATLVLSGISLRRKTDVDYVQSLERRCSIAEQSLDRCRDNEKELKVIITGLEAHNAQLMKMLINLKNNHA